MATTREEYLHQLRESLDGVDLAQPSTTKFVPLDELLRRTAGLPQNAVVSATISKPGNFSVRTDQSVRSRGAMIFVGVCVSREVLEDTKRPARDHVRAGRARAVLLISPNHGGRWEAPWGVRDPGFREYTERLADAFGTSWEPVEMQDSLSQPEGSMIAQPSSNPTVPSLVIDDRTRRMLRTCIASRTAVMLVGPPGTGKSRLVDELLGEAAFNPSALGMTIAHEGRFVTPDESWTTRELVGGETVDDKGRVRFSVGAVLDALVRDAWLVLDEANRADMDRIFGGVLTWLSGQSVTVGRVSGASNAGEITLGWIDTKRSQVTGLEELGAAEPIEPVRFLAGQEWRLIGTYNALDAQRVFRFGLALGRRFAHVPVAPPSVEGFIKALAEVLESVPSAVRAEVGQRVVALYSVHSATPSAALGPALFLGIPAYVAAGLRLGSTNVPELVSEAYLTSAGAWLSRLDDTTLDRLGSAAAEEALDGQWDWVTSQLSALR